MEGRKEGFKEMMRRQGKGDFSCVFQSLAFLPPLNWGISFQFKDQRPQHFRRQSHEGTPPILGFF
nr:hypothetical protein Iba_chr07aCG0170 [Ipomoea batatas]